MAVLRKPGQPLLGGIFVQQEDPQATAKAKEYKDAEALIDKVGGSVALSDAAKEVLRSKMTAIIDEDYKFDPGLSILNTTDRLLQQGSEAAVGAINATANDPLGTAVNVGTGIANFVGDVAQTANDVLPQVQSYEDYKAGKVTDPRFSNFTSEVGNALGNLASGAYNMAIAPGLNAIGANVPARIAFNEKILPYYDPVTGLPTDRASALSANPAAGLGQYLPDTLAAIVSGGASAALPAAARIGVAGAVEGGLGALRGSGEGGGTFGDRVLGGAAQGSIGALLEGLLGAKPALRKGANVTPEEARAAGLTDIYPDAQPRRAPVRGMIESKPTRLIASQSSVSPVDMASRLSTGHTSMVPNAPEAWNPQAGVWNPQVKLRTKSAEDSAAVFRKQAEKQRRLNAQKEGALKRGQKHFDYVQEQTGINPLDNPQAVVKAYSGMRKADGSLTTKGAKLRNSLVQVRKEAKKSAELQQAVMQNGRKAKNGGNAVQQAKAEANAAYAEELVNLGNQRSFTAGPDGVELNPSVAEMNKQSAIRKTAERIDRASNPEAPPLSVTTDRDIANQVADVAEATIIETVPEAAKPTSRKGSAALHAVESLRTGKEPAAAVSKPSLGKPNNAYHYVKQKFQTEAARLLDNDLLSLGMSRDAGNTIQDQTAQAVAKSVDDTRKLLVRTPGVDAEATMAALEDGTYEAWRAAANAGETVPVSPQIQKGFEVVEAQVEQFNKQTVHPLLKRVDPDIKISKDPAYVSRASEHRTVGTVATKDLSPETVQRIMKVNNLKEPPPYIVLEGGATEAEAAALMEGRKGWYSYIAPEVLDNPGIIQYRPSAKQRLLDLTDLGEVTPEGYAALREGLANEGIDITRLDSLLKKLSASTSDDIETLRTIGAIRREVHSSTLKNTGMKIGLGTEGNSLTRAHTQGQQLAATYSRTIQADELVLASDKATAQYRKAEQAIQEATANGDMAAVGAAVKAKDSAEAAAAVIKEQAQQFLGRPTLTDAVVEGAVRYSASKLGLSVNSKQAAHTLKGVASLSRKLHNARVLMGGVASGIANLLEITPKLVNAFVQMPAETLAAALDPRVLMPGGRIDKAMRASKYASAYEAFLPTAGLDPITNVRTADPTFTLRPTLKQVASGVGKKITDLGNIVAFGMPAVSSKIRQNVFFAIADAAGRAKGLAGEALDDYIYANMMRSSSNKSSMHFPLQNDSVGALTTNLVGWAVDAFTQTNKFAAGIVTGTNNAAMDLGASALRSRVASAAGLAVHSAVVGAQVLWPVWLLDNVLTGDKLLGLFGEEDGIAEGPKLFGKNVAAKSLLNRAKAEGNPLATGLLGNVINTSNMGFDIFTDRRFRSRDGDLLFDWKEILNPAYDVPKDVVMALLQQDIKQVTDKVVMLNNAKQANEYEATGRITSPVSGKTIYHAPAPTCIETLLVRGGIKPPGYMQGRAAVQLARETETAERSFTGVAKRTRTQLAAGVLMGVTSQEAAQLRFDLLVKMGEESGVISADTATVWRADSITAAMAELQDNPTQLGALDSYGMEDSLVPAKQEDAPIIRKVQNKLEPVTMNKPQLRGIK